MEPLNSPIPGISRGSHTKDLDLEGATHGLVSKDLVLLDLGTNLLPATLRALSYTSPLSPEMVKWDDK